MEKYKRNRLKVNKLPNNKILTSNEEDEECSHHFWKISEARSKGSLPALCFQWLVF